MRDPAERHRLFVDELAARGAFSGSPIEAAFRAVPRHHFLPELPIDEVYRDRMVITKVGDRVPLSASSQPSFMATMLAQLELEPGHRVLEIGTGTGYNAALMGHIVGKTGRVITLDIDRDIADRARVCLGAAGSDAVEVVWSDGGLGHAPGAPYDRIIVTVGAADIAPALRGQLTSGGRLVIPLSLNGPQRSIAFLRLDDVLYGVSTVDCDFGTSLRGRFGGVTTRLSVDAGGGCWVWFDGERAADRRALAAWLRGESTRVGSGRAAAVADVFGGLYLWLALHDPRFVQLGASETTDIPGLLGLPGKLVLTAGLLDASGIALLDLEDAGPAASLADPRVRPLGVRGFGESARLVRRLVELIGAWSAAGEPGTPDLRVIAYPRGWRHRRSPGEFVIDRRWSRLVLSW